MLHAIYFFVLNMNKNEDRYKNIKQMLDSLSGCKYSRIEAIDGYHMEKDKNAKNILSCRQELLGEKFSYINFHKTNLEEWYYDGTIRKSFPGLSLDGNMGAKGLVLSNMKAFEVAKSLPFSWYCILEDDAEIDLDAYISILKFLYHNYNKFDIILLDKRGNGFGGTSGVLYKSTIIKQVSEELHPLSQFSITLEEKTTMSTLWDWKLHKYLEIYQIKYGTLPCIGSGKFDSTISI